MEVVCPACGEAVKPSRINDHLDSNCKTHLLINTTDGNGPSGSSGSSGSGGSGGSNGSNGSRGQSSPSGTQKTATLSQKRPASSFFQTPSAKRQATKANVLTPTVNLPNGKTCGVKRKFEQGPGRSSPVEEKVGRKEGAEGEVQAQPNANLTAAAIKRPRTSRSAPLAERMRPESLDHVFGQDLVGSTGVLRSLIEADRVPSMILWGGSGTGKTTIARCIARRVGSRFIELNATSTGVAECKKYFAEAATELGLTGRKTIIFCDEIHRFSKAQQDVFLKPVEAGTITLIGATTENPSFKVQGALLSRCRTFTLKPLSREHLQSILLRALREEMEKEGRQPSLLIDEEMLAYLSAFADGDARTALNLLELALSLTAECGPDGRQVTKEDIKASLTKTLVYDRAGDQHYDSISAFHKSIRGSDADAALYYLARMLQSGEDALFVARRLVVIASEDVGLADNTLLSLAVSTFTATQQIGMPEARIPLAHCTVALCQAPKSTRAYRALNNAYSSLHEPGVASLPVPLHLRNAPTRLLRDMGHGAAYKYPPNYKDGRVKQEYMPEALRGRKFLEERDLGTEVDADLDMTDAP